MSIQELCKALNNGLTKQFNASSLCGLQSPSAHPYICGLPPTVVHLRKRVHNKLLCTRISHQQRNCCESLGSFKCYRYTVFFWSVTTKNSIFPPSSNIFLPILNTNPSMFILQRIINTQERKVGLHSCCAFHEDFWDRKSVGNSGECQRSEKRRRLRKHKKG